MSSKGRGNYQKFLRKITEIQIVYALLERPYTKGELREKTNIQNNTLSEILNYFTEKQMLVRHKLIIKKSYLDYGDDDILKLGSKYFIINLDNIDVQRYIADPTPVYLLEYLQDIDHSSDGELKKYGSITLKKIKSLSLRIVPLDYCSKELIADVERDVERDFSHLESIKGRTKNIENIKTGHEYNILLKKFIKFTKESRFEIEESIRNLKPPYLEIMDDFIKNKAGSPLDFLIYMACKDYKDGSKYITELYRANWKTIKEFTDNEWKT